jgi:universal stress protein A
MRTVLCPVDFSPLSDRALTLAVRVCQLTGARLILHHNLDVRPPSYLSVSWMWSEEHEEGEEDHAEESRAQIQELFSRIPKSIQPEAKMTRGPLETTLLFLARQIPADVIVMGSHGPSNPAHSSLTEKIIIQAPCPVLTIGESYDAEAERSAHQGKLAGDMPVLIPIDFTKRSIAALRFAFDMASSMPHRLHVAHYLSPADGALLEGAHTEDLKAARERLSAFVPPHLSDRVTFRSGVAEPVKGILETARELDALFILMAAHGKGPLARYLFGTTTVGVLHGSECPVWFVPDRAARRRRRMEFAFEPSADVASG